MKWVVFICAVLFSIAMISLKNQPGLKAAYSPASAELPWGWQEMMQETCMQFCGRNPKDAINSVKIHNVSENQSSQ